MPSVAESRRPPTDSCTERALTSIAVLAQIACDRLTERQGQGPDDAPLIGSSRAPNLDEADVEPAEEDRIHSETVPRDGRLPEPAGT